MKNRVFISIVLLLMMSACQVIDNDPNAESSDSIANGGDGMGILARMGLGSGMMNRHHIQVPDEYAGLTNPIPTNGATLASGGDIYTKHCATCHGDFGNGDGPGGVNLDPAPSPIAHTSQMMSDAYLFWRITEGGIPFETGMIPYRDILDEAARWDVINYIRALGSGKVQPDSRVGGSPFDQESELAQRGEMLAEAVEKGILSQEEAETFDLVHTAMDDFTQMGGVSGMKTNPERVDALPQILETLVENGKVTENQATIFLVVHDRLVDSGLME